MLSKERRDRYRKLAEEIPSDLTRPEMLMIFNVCDQLEAKNVALVEALGKCREEFETIGHDAEDYPMAAGIIEMIDKLLGSSKETMHQENCFNCGLPMSSPPHLVDGKCPENPDEVEV